MNLPIDTCENGSCSFAIRGEYDKRVYAKNLGLGVCRGGWALTNIFLFTPIKPGVMEVYYV